MCGMQPGLENKLVCFYSFRPLYLCLLVKELEAEGDQFAQDEDWKQRETTSLAHSKV